METLEESLSAFIAESLPQYLTQLLSGWLLGEKLDDTMVIHCSAISMTIHPNRKLTRTVIRVIAGYTAFASNKGIRIEYKDPRIAKRLEDRIKEGVKLWDKHHYGKEV
jgi:hypothetical protein